MSGSDLILVLISIFFPPFAVAYRRGICSADLLINICLCVLGFLPGLLHAWYIIAKYPSGYYYNLDLENHPGDQHTVYVEVPSGSPSSSSSNQRQAQEQQPNYGSTSDANPKPSKSTNPPAYKDTFGNN
ncbi:UPF0057-domain-containing protein [Nadsonia fulvescens var. elongata DSM 6958]|uniref:UPF0057-domain-containing protein n=1 Tax=Nadsonia fulvescens var. elongata DSM 6958 TaxID=857566 RepID=A0A1E3PGU7_9ASCO|nr:UPF0057-domain-containing protein [Nadsonia fulvescens var. elongata DSM 6958]